MTTYSVVSLGAVVVGLSITAWYTTTWWVGSKKHSAKELFPFIAFSLYGMLLILTAGGILGGLAGGALWGSSQVGDAALTFGVGATFMLQALRSMPKGPVEWSTGSTLSPTRILSLVDKSGEAIVMPLRLD